MSSTAMDDREPPLKKRKTQSNSYPWLPDDLLVSCLTRVSKLHYPTLSLVSKRFRSLLSSPELNQTRSLLGRSTESYLYVSLDIPSNPNPCWFTLCKKPNQFLTEKTKKKKKKKKKEKSSCHELVPIPSPPQSPHGAVVASGSKIYSFGGLLYDGKPSSSVSVLDCRSNTWHQAPDMSVDRWGAGAHVIDGKIYVVGGDYSRCGVKSLIEVFDPKSQTWNSLRGPHQQDIDESIKIGEKICIFYNRGEDVAYNPKDGTCEPLEKEMRYGCDYNSHCVIDNVLFSYSRYHLVFKWFDRKARLWRDLKGLERIMCRMDEKSSVKLSNYGEKMVVLWDRKVPHSNKLWCAVLAVERRNTSEEKEIWATVEWFDAVLTVPKVRDCFVDVLSTTL